MKDTYENKITPIHKRKSIIRENTELYQSNRVTYFYNNLSCPEGGYTLIQGRIFISLIKELQDAIRADMNGKDWQSLPVYLSNENDLIRIPIRLKDFAHPRQYKEVYESALELGKRGIILPSSVNKEHFSIDTLFIHVEFPKNIKGYSVMYVAVLKSYAKMLIEIDRTPQGRPGYYTKYFYEVAIHSTNKYTYKLYMIIASWRQKRGFRISFESLKLQLGIPVTEYKEFKEFKRRVLLPVQKDLEGKSDCWFNCALTGFEERKDKAVKYLNFKIIIPTPEGVIKSRLDHIIHLLKTHFQFDENESRFIADKIKGLIGCLDTYQQLLQKLTALNVYIHKSKNTSSSVNNIARYTLASITEWLKIKEG